MAHNHDCLKNLKKPWRARVMVKGKKYDLGFFKTKEEAEKAEKKKKAELLSDINDLCGFSSEKYEGEKLERTDSDDEIVLNSSSINIKTLEELLAYSEIDIEKWEAYKVTTNAWDVSMNMHDGTTKTVKNHQIKAHLRLIVKHPLHSAIQNLIEKIPEFYPANVIFSKPKEDYAVELSILDAHIGKLAWGLETGQGDYDSEIAVKDFLNVAYRNIDDCMKVTDGKISKIFIPIGQDYFHVENLKEITPFGGNKLDVDTRLHLIFETGLECMMKMIYMCRDISEIELIWIPGNHDPLISYFLCQVLKAHFSKDDRVSVDISPQWRKARLWGNLLVGFSHDAEGRRLEATVNMLPQYFPKEWGISKFREWHVGHLHKKAEKKFAPTQTLGGVVIRRITALSKIDAWHYQHGFVDAIPGGESFVWTKDRGIKTANTEYILD